MARGHRGVDIPPAIYHSVPKGWHADEIFDAHKLMRGIYPISEFKIGEWYAPSFMTERYEWLRYTETLDRIAAGIRAGDEACVEIAIRYLERRFIGSYSGYKRAKLARALRRAHLDDRQIAQLNSHFLKIVIERDYTDEFREYRKLWSLFATKDILQQMAEHFQKQPSNQPAWFPDFRAACEKRFQSCEASGKPRSTRPRRKMRKSHALHVWFERAS